MKTNNIKNISNTIILIDKRITELLNEKELNVDKIETLSNLRFDYYTKELNNLIRVKNTREMYNRKK